MPLYLTRGNYTREGFKGLMAKPEDRTEAVRKLIEAAGGKLHSLYFTFGEYDFLLISEASSEKEVTAALLAAAGTGTVTNLNTTIALTGADMKDVLIKANSLSGQFRPAGT
jgi:uncharacterized protein with GYD domain